MIGSGSTTAHHLEKYSSHFPNEEPLLHVGLSIILLSYTPISIGLSATPNLNETYLRQIEWLSAHQAKGEVESEKYLVIFGENESLGAQSQGEGEKTGVVPSSNYWIKNFLNPKMMR